MPIESVYNAYKRGGSNSFLGKYSLLGSPSVQSNFANGWTGNNSPYNFVGSTPYASSTSFVPQAVGAAATLAAPAQSWGAMSGWQKFGGAMAILGGLSQMADNSMTQMANQYTAQADQARNNAKLAEAQNLQTGISGMNEANAMRERGRRMVSSAQTDYGASGVVSNAGSAASTQAAMAGRAEADAQTIRQNTLMKQWALSAEQNQYETQARNYDKMSHYYKKQQRTSQFMGLLNTALAVGKLYAGGI